MESIDKNALLQKANVLIEALPYIRRFHGTGIRDCNRNNTRIRRVANCNHPFQLTRRIFKIHRIDDRLHQLTARKQSFIVTS